MKVQRLDPSNTKLHEQALEYAQLKLKEQLIKVRGTSMDVESGEQLEGIEEIIKGLSQRRRLSESDNDEDEIPESPIQIQLKELISKYNIKVDR